MSGRPAWIAVASAEHVARGVEGGFMQVCHGKRGPLARLRPGDGVVYSPTVEFRDGGKLQAFTALGRVGEGSPMRSTWGRLDPLSPRRRLAARQRRPHQTAAGKSRVHGGARQLGLCIPILFFPIDQADFAVIEAGMLSGG